MANKMRGTRDQAVISLVSLLSESKRPPGVGKRPRRAWHSLGTRVRWRWCVALLVTFALVPPRGCVRGSRLSLDRHRAVAKDGEGGGGNGGGGNGGGGGKGGGGNDGGGGKGGGGNDSGGKGGGGKGGGVEA